MTTKLDRLVTLLDTGSSALIRNEAATQLANIQKSHPDDLFNLLARVVPYLKAKKWDTRMAAARALGGIADNCSVFAPNEDDGEDDFDVKADPDEPVRSDDQLSLDTLDVQAILDNGKKLLGSSGQQYDYALNSLDPSQRLVHQKRTLTARLGLGGEYTEEELIDEGDVKPAGKDLQRLDTLVERHSIMSDAVLSPQEQTPQTPGGDDAGLSKRQLNMLKRKTKKELKFHPNKVRVVDFSERRPSTNLGSAAPREPASAADANGTDYFNLEPGEEDTTKLVAEFKGQDVPVKSEFEPDADEIKVDWPFERLCEFLMVDMFDHNWEVRHGAAMGLRDVLRTHGGAAGRERGKTRAQNDVLNRRWLDDLACRLCCIFMLDRFGDYVADNVVSPVRETAGQTLGVLLKFMPPAALRSTYHVLQLLVRQDTFSSSVWQACHGGMVGLRYLVAVRTDLFLDDDALLNDMLDVVVKGLADWDDDVRAVSAATLIPVCDDIVKRRPAALPALVRVVWDCLSNLSDDLSASTGSVMDLLAKLCSYPEVLETMKANAAGDDEQTFAELVPRLFPFLRHTIPTVRLAVLRALLTFLALDGPGTRDWIDGKALRLVFQNLVVERNEGVLALSLQVFEGMAGAPSDISADLEPHKAALVQLTLHPIGVPRRHISLPPGLLIRPSGAVFVVPDWSHAGTSPGRNGSEPPSKRRRKGPARNGAADESLPPPVSASNIDNPMIQGDIDLVGFDVMLKAKIAAAKALAKVISLWPSEARLQDFQGVVDALASPHSTSRVAAAIVAEGFARHSPDDDFKKALLIALTPLVEEQDAQFFAELRNYLAVAQQNCFALQNTLETKGKVDYEKLPHVGGTIAVAGDEFSKYSFSIAQGEHAVGQGLDRAKALMSAAHRITSAEALEAARIDATRSLDEAKAKQEQCVVRVKAAAAAAVVALGAVPKKPSLTIKGVMDSVKQEDNVDLQRRSAAAIVALIQHMVRAGRKVVVDKVVGNLVNFYCQDAAETPDFRFNAGVGLGLLSLRKDEDIADHADPAKFAQDAKDARIKRRGAREALECMAVSFGAELFATVAVLRDLVEAPLREALAGALPANITEADNDLGQRLVDSLSTLRALVPKLDAALHPFVLGLLAYIIAAVKCPLAVLRYAAAKCLATICSVMTVDGFTALVTQVLPAIGNAADAHERQGAVECVYHLIHTMGDGILPYVIFLIVPILGRMSDSDNDIRLIATTAFATLVKLVPLEAGIPDPPGLSKELLQGRERERQFMAQMMDVKKVEPFVIPVAIKAQLRSYQQDGVNWLAFLNRYHLHGILCDDMGLGKTLQTLCIVASDHHLRAQEFARSGSPDARRLPSLIVCPPTLAGHWQQEIAQYAPFLTAVAYVGSPAERERARQRVGDADVVITSYEICRNAVDFFAATNWNYCVLDEGHLIKNPNAKTSQAVKRLLSNHRLILSGTPIQNNVLELWSLFDFLMPGFLGSEKVFKDRFAKPIAASRFSKSSSKEQEAGALAVEALHKQVLPFLLRRLKEEVLDDLPPKIIQNYYCELSEVQRKLFEHFTKRAGKALSDKLAVGDKQSKQHIFQALQYMRKLCNSPKLVLKGPEDQQYAAIRPLLAKHKSDVADPAHAPKLGALKQLLVDCGIGAADVAAGAAAGLANDDMAAAASAVSPHRALIFCQMKEMLDIVQNTVLAKMLPSVTFLRLDGSVEASRRQAIVNKFNSDPSIDVLLLTTSVGGLGLNLTGADTVIFVEHDWNPQKDIQAMDRAHRIGQKRVVNVYRLITRGTLEEKILNLQRFKIDVASTVVNQQNAALASMETDQILDLFSLSDDAAPEPPPDEPDAADAVDAATGQVKARGAPGLLDGLGELWDEGEYAAAFNLDEFLGSVK